MGRAPCRASPPEPEAPTTDSAVQTAARSKQNLRRPRPGALETIAPSSQRGSSYASLASARPPASMHALASRRSLSSRASPIGKYAIRTRNRDVFPVGSPQVRRDLLAVDLCFDDELICARTGVSER